LEELKLKLDSFSFSFFILKWKKILVQFVLINPLHFSALGQNLQNPIQTTRVHLFAARLGFKETLAL